MMKMTGKAFAKKLFGARYERLLQTILLDVIIFWGLYIAGFQVQITASRSEEHTSELQSQR